MRTLCAVQLSSLEEPTVVTVGSFDGVHRGHRALLQRLTTIARSEGLRSVVVTFDPHPRIALGRAEGLQLLTTSAEKEALLADAGVDYLVVLPFDRHYAQQCGEAFAREFLMGKLQARVLVAGYNHRFGHDRIEAASLRIDGLRIERVEAVEWQGYKVSSTVIRNLLAEGKTEEAKELLGGELKILNKVERQKSIHPDR